MPESAYFSVAFDLQMLSELQLNTHQIISKQYEYNERDKYPIIHTVRGEIQMILESVNKK